ncbi:hypothetical protein BLTE_26530 [Blastochloris tepida]|uniref:Uncharacterized protein n=1 Tax=Blastochloris tepida TaxID=2233851 RepID=A0A348G335_9HYPH|nr:hypothetical protein BLTE_26530 [Blastochloris tepida]
MDGRDKPGHDDGGLVPDAAGASHAERDRVSARSLSAQAIQIRESRSLRETGSTPARLLAKHQSGPRGPDFSFRRDRFRYAKKINRKPYDATLSLTPRECG